MFFQRLLFKRYLDKKENIIFVIHQHWIVIKDQMLKIGLFGYLIPLGVIFFFTGPFSPLSLLFYFWLLCSMCYSLYIFLDWYLDAWLLTDISMIDTIWDGFFKRRSSRIEYTSIESIDIETRGIQQAILNYGNILLIKSSGIHVKMESVSNPQLASSWISKIQTQVKAAKNAQNTESLKSLLADIIQEHIKVNS